jgi:hypothetical protein
LGPKKDITKRAAKSPLCAINGRQIDERLTTDMGPEADSLLSYGILQKQLFFIRRQSGHKSRAAPDLIESAGIPKSAI